MLDGRANHESIQRGASPILPGTPEGVWEHDSTPRTLKSSFRLPPSYESDDDARTLHTPVMAGHKSPPVPRSPPYFPDTAVLVPRIVVTPEHGTVDEGTVTVWVAVQLSAQVCRTLGPEQGHSTATDYRLSPDALRYGFLYDVSTELLPAGKSTIIEVLDDKACAKILHPGSRLLFVAHVRLEPAARRRPRTHVRQKSDDLIEDLEHELGGTVTEYLQVRVAYRHSGFPQIHKQTAGAVGTTAPDGISTVQTIIQTTATAAIKRHNSASPWSPPPSLPRPNPLFEVIASHWGVDNAHAVMQRVIRSRSVRPNAGHPFGEPPVLGFISSLATPRGQDGHSDHQSQRNPANVTGPGIPRPASSPPTRAAAAPPIPRRQASLRRVAVTRQGPGSVVGGGSTSSRSGARAATEKQQQQQQRGLGLGLRGKWTDAAPAALTPVVVDVKIMDGGEEGQGKKSDGGVVVGNGSSSNGSVKTRKGREKERGWGWTGWWQ
ncbi:hypothetical protein C8A01DRAFT_37010 [Parachaetomium inaequale]|uniref:Uncharacterized protein n=1 Tax=Parachaetomium inaequale TaxID=2588326 RepID=A0AAN6SQY6_9PEZI|nr:hypothetical protein C8A01DRAFT_37010 [Parachaetomium inaequale]